MKIDFKLIDFLVEKVTEIHNNTKNINDLKINNKEGNDIVTDVDIYIWRMK